MRHAERMGGKETCLPHRTGSGRTANGAFAPAKRTDRPGVLNLRTDKIKLEPKPSVKIDSLLARNEWKEYFEKRAQNYATQKGFTLETKTVNDTLSLTCLIKELSDKGHETIRLFLNENEPASLKLTHEKMDACLELFFIPIKPTYDDMNERLGEITRLFIRDLAEAFNLNNITDNGNFDYACDMIEEDADANKDDKDLQDMRLLALSYKNGEIQNRLSEITDNKFKDGQKHFNPKELDDIVPSNESERKLIELLQEGYQYLDHNNNINLHGEIYNEYGDETDVQRLYDYGSLITIDDQIFITYDKDDAVTQFVFETIESTNQSGAYCESMITIDEIPAEGDVTLDPSFEEGLKFIDRLNWALNNF